MGSARFVYYCSELKSVREKRVRELILYCLRVFGELKQVSMWELVELKKTKRKTFKGIRFILFANLWGV